MYYFIANKKYLTNIVIPVSLDNVANTANVIHNKNNKLHNIVLFVSFLEYNLMDKS